MTMKRLLTIALSAILTITMAAPAAVFTAPDTMAAGDFTAEAATTYTDIQGHWAAYYIMNANYYGIISGYGNGKFQPDKPVTRAEFATMANKAFGNVLAYDVSFRDVSTKSWYYNDVCKSVNAGITSGYEDNTYRPNKNISRQEAACIIARIIPQEGSFKPVASYSDGKKVQGWANAAMQRVMGENIMGPYDDGKLHPNDSLTRAQAATILVKTKEAFKKTTEPDDITITKGSITYNNTIFCNSVTISSKIGDEDVKFDNCVFLGPLKVQGGGTKSIHLKNCRVKYMEVDKPSDSVRVSLEGDTSVGVAELYKACILETDNTPLYFDSYGVGQVVIKKGATAELEGYFKDVRITGESASVKMSEGRVDYLEIPVNCSQASVTVDRTSSITNAVVKSQTAFHGTGKITKLYAGTKEITYETAPTTVTMGDDVRVSPVKVNSEIAVSSNPANGETDVDMETKITITFNQPIYRNGKVPTLDYVKSKIKFTAKKASGDEVPCSFSANADWSSFTIVPNETLTKKTKYYISIEKEAFTNEDKTIKNKKAQIMFTTGDGTVDGVVFKPAKDSAGAKTNVKPTITFADSVIAYDGDEDTELDEFYLKQAITFYKYDEEKTGGVGKKVTFKAEINKKRKGITITPSTALDDNSVYYIGIKDQKFRYEKTFNAIKGQTIPFSVGYTVPQVTFEPDPTKTKTQAIDADQNFEIIFNELVYMADLKKLTKEYVMAGITLNAGGASVTYKVNKIELDTDEGTTTIDITAKGIPEGTDVTLTVLDNKFFNKNKKAAEKTVGEYTLALTTPVISGLSATGAGGEVVATFSSNLSGTGYVAVSSSNDDLSAAQVKSQGTSGRVGQGSNYITVKKDTIKSGQTYTVYAVVISGGKTSNVLKARVSTDYAEAFVNKVEVTDLTQTSDSAVTSLVIPVEDSMEVELNLADYTPGAATHLEVAAPADTTVLFYDMTTGEYLTEFVSGTRHYVELNPADFVAGSTISIKVKAVCAVKEDKVYTVKINVL